MYPVEKYTNSDTKNVQRVCEEIIYLEFASTVITPVPMQSLSLAIATLNFISIVDLDISGLLLKNLKQTTMLQPLQFLLTLGESGRKVQVFQTDGDGVFASSDTRELLETEKVRHEWSAPYDSNTNAFIERARRTVFEGVCTALLRAGAPARFWGEAECHKIYTLNLLPTVPERRLLLFKKKFT